MYDIHDRLSGLFHRTMGMKRSQNMSNQEKTALRKLRLNKNVNSMTRIKMSALLALIKRRSLRNAEDSCTKKRCIYNQLTQEEANQLIRVIKKHLSNFVNKHTIRGNCSKRESEFLLSNLNKFNIPHFYIIWKILKNPIVGRPIVAGYNWILTPASIFVGHYLKKFCNKFDTILSDSLSLLKILGEKKTYFNMHRPNHLPKHTKKQGVPKTE